MLLKYRLINEKYFNNKQTSPVTVSLIINKYNKRKLFASYDNFIYLK